MLYSEYPWGIGYLAQNENAEFLSHSSPLSLLPTTFPECLPQVLFQFVSQVTCVFIPFKSYCDKQGLMIDKIGKLIT